MTTVKRKILSVASAAIMLVAAAGASIPAYASTPAQTPPTSGPAQAGTGAGHGLVVKSSTELGPITENPRVDARDNGQSVLYRGKSYWFFDDTILQNPFGFLSSTAAATSDLDASDGITMKSSSIFNEADQSEPANFVPYSAAEQAFQKKHASDDCTGSADKYCGMQFAFWPGAAIADPARGRILVFYGKLCRGGPDDGPCASGFVGQPLGSGIVAINMRTHKIERMRIAHRDQSLTSPEGTDPTQMFPTDQNWGAGGAVLVGRMLYGYGNCTSDNQCGVARVPVDLVQDRAAWRYYSGTSHGIPQWSRAASDSVAVMHGGAAGETVQYDPWTHQYINTFAAFLDNQVKFQTAPTPWGPWTQPQNLFYAKKTSGTEYAAFAHPEYTTNHGLTRYFTYYTSSTGAQMLVRVDFERR